MTGHFDLVILGSGSTAFAAALAAQEMGKTAVMTEERVVGGTCVNRGCLPSKNLIEAARLLHDARNPRYPGLTPASVGVDFAALIVQKDDRGRQGASSRVIFNDLRLLRSPDGTRRWRPNRLATQLTVGTAPLYVPGAATLAVVAWVGAAGRCPSGRSRP